MPMSGPSARPWNARRAPFYLRRTKEAMVYFPERRPDGTWAAEKIFTKRIPHTVDFQIDGPEFELYRDVTRFVKRQSARAAAEGDDPRARAVGFLMSLYQRRLASSTYAMRHQLGKPCPPAGGGLKRAQELARLGPARPARPGRNGGDGGGRAGAAGGDARGHHAGRERRPGPRGDRGTAPAGRTGPGCRRFRCGGQALEAQGPASAGRLLRSPDQRLLLFTEFKERSTTWSAN